MTWYWWLLIGVYFAFGLVLTGMCVHAAVDQRKPLGNIIYLAICIAWPAFAVAAIGWGISEQSHKTEEARKPSSQATPDNLPKRDLPPGPPNPPRPATRRDVG